MKRTEKEGTEVVRKVRATVQRRLPNLRKHPLVVGVSGGADSMMLLHFLRHEGYRLVAVHCNFQLRGEEADRDEQVVRTFCREQEIELTVQRFDTRSYAREHGISIEMAARDLRYGEFRRVMRNTPDAMIAVAHHADDNVETMLYHLMRGTGLRGMAGMAYRTEDVVRPLLNLTRRDILTYNEAYGVPFITDSSNLVDDVARNKIRLNVIPEMKKVLPSADRSMRDAVERLRGAFTFFDIGVQYLLQELVEKRVVYPEQVAEEVMNKEKLLAFDERETLLFEWLHPAGFNSQQVMDILEHIEGVSGRVFETATHRLLLDRGRLLLQVRCVPQPLAYTQVTRHAMKEFPEVRKQMSPFTLAFDADKLQGEVHVRLYAGGDTFVPFGMKGRKNISDFLTDRKYSLFDKEHVTLLCCGDEVVGIVGERIDERFRIDDRTENIVVYHFTPYLDDRRRMPSH